MRFRIVELYAIVLVALQLCSAFSEERRDFRGCYTAVSLAAIEKNQDYVADGQLLSSKSLGFSRLRAAIIDEVASDVILIGVNKEGEKQFTIGEIATLARVTEIGSSGRTGISLEPKDGNVKSKKLVTEFRGPTAGNFLGEIAFRADYLMKEIAIGKVPMGVYDFEPYAPRLRDYLIAKSSKEHSNLNILSRFEFQVYEEKGDTLITAQGDVVIVWDRPMWVKVERLSQNGNRLVGVADRDEAAESYAGDFNRRWTDLCKVHTDIAQLERIPTALALFQLLYTDCLKSSGVISRLDFLRSRVAIRPSFIPHEVDLIEKEFREEQGTVTVFGGVRLCGLGLQMRTSGSDSALHAFKELALAARPGIMSMSWNFVVNDDWSVAAAGLDKNASEVAKLYIRGINEYDEGFANADVASMKSAVSTFQCVCDREPESYEARLIFAIAKRELALYKGELDAVASCLGELHAIADNNRLLLEPKFEIGKTLFVLGRAAEAISILNRIVERRPDYGPAQQVLGLAYRAEGDMVGAKRHLNAFLQIPGQPARLVTEAKNAILAIEGKGEKTRAAFDPGNKLRFNVPETWRRLTRDEMKRIPETDSPADSLLMVYRHPDDPDNNLNVRIQNVDADTISDDEVRQAIPALDTAYQQKFKGYVRLEAGPLETAGAKGMKIKFSCDRAGVKIMQCTISLVKNKRMMTLTFTAKERDFDKCWEECFSPALTSMTWGETVAGSAKK